MPQNPYPNPVKVGARCQVTLLYKDCNLACGFDNGSGFILWSKHAGATVTLPPGYFQRRVTQGQNTGRSVVVGPTGGPSPEVMMFVALMTGEQSHRLECIQQWCAVRPEEAGYISIRAGFGTTYHKPKPLDGNCRKNLMSLAHRDEHLFRDWVKEWLFSMFVIDREKDVCAWLDAARLIVNTIKALDSTGPAEHEDEYNAQLIHREIIAAIKFTANDCAGVPYQSAILNKLNDGRAKKMKSDNLRQRLRSLGFAWLPGKDAWLRDWEPLIKEHGW